MARRSLRRNHAARAKIAVRREVGRLRESPTLDWEVPGARGMLRRQGRAYALSGDFKLGLLRSDPACGTSRNAMLSRAERTKCELRRLSLLAKFVCSIHRAQVSFTHRIRMNVVYKRGRPFDVE